VITLGWRFVAENRKRRPMDAIASIDRIWRVGQVGEYMIGPGVVPFAV